MCLICDDNTCEVKRNLQSMILSGITAPAVEVATQKELERIKELEIELRRIRQAIAHLHSRNYEVFYETSDQADQDEEADGEI
ncbi:hypothetical protein BD626DRAFT_566286 [Schizophyllum amplum]|uniref:Uncharacterized protein n=1 Tax=Schizophyllum amplum TaxID=97359 RepID=A0A550CR71_9AGAR|nr:hypothetical protein BD626DRAFT_566286 [Auriculariopsis ampla]